jgi:hypothetical protein
MEENLELIINNEPWTVILTNRPEHYWKADSKNKVLYVNNVDVNKAKFQCWLQYKKR